MESIYYIYIGIALALLVTLFFVFKPKKQKLVVVDKELINAILDSVKKSNIANVESEVSRVKIEVKNLDEVDFDSLKSISEGVFISGKSIKIMFKDSADNIVNNLRKEL